MENEVFNPNNLPIENLLPIYGFINGGSPGFYHCLLISRKGEILGDHLCSNEEFAKKDLGIYKGSRPDRHVKLKEKFPKGYRMEYIPMDKLDTHIGFQTALKICNASKEG